MRWLRYCRFSGFTRVMLTVRVGGVDVVVIDAVHRVQSMFCLFFSSIDARCEVPPSFCFFFRSFF